jgi:hypothetical protein
VATLKATHSDDAEKCRGEAYSFASAAKSPFASPMNPRGARAKGAVLFHSSLRRGGPTGRVRPLHINRVTLHINRVTLRDG